MKSTQINWVQIVTSDVLGIFYRLFFMNILSVQKKEHKTVKRMSDIYRHAATGWQEPGTGCVLCLPEVAQLGLAATLLLAHSTIAGERHVAADPAVLRGSFGAAGGHDLLAGQAAVGPPQALLVDAHAAAVAVCSLQDVLGAHAAVGGLVEQVRVVPAVLALAEELPDVRFPLGALGAAPQRDDHRHDDGQGGPQQQRPLLPGAALVLRVVRFLVHRCRATDAGGAVFGRWRAEIGGEGKRLRKWRRALSGRTPQSPRRAHVHGPTAAGANFSLMCEHFSERRAVNTGTPMWRRSNELLRCLRKRVRVRKKSPTGQHAHAHNGLKQRWEMASRHFNLVL